MPQVYRCGAGVCMCDVQLIVAGADLRLFAIVPAAIQFQDLTGESNPKLAHQPAH